MKIRNENYYTIKGWMINKLGLKGTQLALYAIIYGFSQDGFSVFKGSVGYLAEFVGVTENSARMNLRELEKKGLITITSEIGAVNSYAVKIERIFEKTGEGGIDILPKKENAGNGQYLADIKKIVDYLNEKTGKQFRASASETYRPIMARLKEGYKIEDFKKVIDIKCLEWLNNETMNVYLRPQTLFGSKFQSYLNQKQPEKAEASYDIDSFKKSAMTKKLEYRRKE